jgi:hypothetical protein
VGLSHIGPEKSNASMQKCVDMPALPDSALNRMALKKM